MARSSEPMEVYACRLHPGEDLRKSIARIALEQKIDAGVVLGAVGSLESAQIRMANQPEATLIPGTLEVLSLSGTLGRGGVHLHIMVSDGSGRCIGGHLMDGSLIYTTLELVIGILPGLRFERQVDSATGYRELAVEDSRETNSK